MTDARNAQAQQEGGLDADLLPLLYDELRRRADALMQGERADHTLQPTALVNEAYLRIVEQDRVRWQDRDRKSVV